MKYVLGGVLYLLLLTSCAQDSDIFKSEIDKVRASKEYQVYSDLKAQRRVLLELYITPPFIEADHKNLSANDLATYTENYTLMKELKKKVRTKAGEIYSANPDLSLDVGHIPLNKYVDELDYPLELKDAVKKLNLFIYGPEIRDQIKLILKKFPTVSKEEVVGMDINDLSKNK